MSSLSYKWRVNIFPKGNYHHIDSMSLVFLTSKNNVIRFIRSYLFDNVIDEAIVTFIDEANDFNIFSFDYHIDPKKAINGSIQRVINNFSFEPLYK